MENYKNVGEFLSKGGERIANMSMRKRITTFVVMTASSIAGVMFVPYFQKGSLSLTLSNSLKPTNVFAVVSLTLLYAWIYFINKGRMYQEKNRAVTGKILGKILSVLALGEFALTGWISFTDNDMIVYCKIINCAVCITGIGVVVWNFSRQQFKLHVVLALLFCVAIMAIPMELVWGFTKITP